MGGGEGRGGEGVTISEAFHPVMQKATASRGWRSGAARRRGVTVCNGLVMAREGASAREPRSALQSWHKPRDGTSALPAGARLASFKP